MRIILVEAGQSLIDVAIQEFGTADALSAICGLNNLEFDEDIYPGQSLLLPDVDPDNDIQTYFKNNNIQVNAHLDEGDIEVLAVDDEEVLGDNDDNLIGV